MIGESELFSISDYEKVAPKQSFEDIYHTVNNAFKITTSNYDLTEDRPIDVLYEDTDDTMVKILTSLSGKEKDALEHSLSLMENLLPRDKKTLPFGEKMSAVDAAQRVIAVYDDIYENAKDKQAIVKSAQEYLYSLKSLN